jgi:hypothetical protein
LVTQRREHEREIRVLVGKGGREHERNVCVLIGDRDAANTRRRSVQTEVSADGFTRFGGGFRVAATAQR